MVRPNRAAIFARRRLLTQPHWGTIMRVAQHYPITYAYPARTLTRITIGAVSAGLGGIGVLLNLLPMIQSIFQSNVGPFVVALALLVYGAGILWGIKHPQEIALTQTELHLPKTVIGGPARAIPYEDVIGVSLILHKWGRTAIIYTVGHKFSFNTHMVGHAKFFDLIDQLHAHANLGPPPVGTIGGLFRAGREAFSG